MKRLFDALINFIFPTRCILCDELISPDLYFCKYCHGKIEFPVEKRCSGCGLDIKKCECNEFIYHFDSVISPFYNKGYAKQGLYRFKFDKDLRAGEYYSSKMAALVKKTFDISDFDFITSVCPSDKTDEFDHSGILAKKISDKLKIPYKVTLTPSSKKRVTQHKLGFSDRFENVHCAYKTLGRYKNKRILLVDDIKTSGATIDECARQLKFSGAKKVHCVTALVGSGQNAD